MARTSRRDGQRRVRLLDPDLRSLPRRLAPEELDAGQSAAVSAFLEGCCVIAHGAPGSGRTSLALTAALRCAEAGEDPRGPVLLLSPRRGTAGPLRDAVALAGAASTVRASTPAALAFALVRADALEAGRGEPSLVTGSEQDALLVELIGVRKDWHLDLDPAARGLPGFRTEMRELITRAAELGIGPEELDARGLEHSRPAWRDAAAILRSYREVLALQSATALDAGPRLDSGDLVRSAADTLDRPPGRALVVDDAQDLTAAGIALVEAIAATGIPLLVTSCPDLAVDTFRGAVPEAASRIGAEREVTLPGGHRGPASVRRAADDLRGRLPLAGTPTALRRTPETPGDGSLSVLRAADELEEARMIASALRDIHHDLGTPYDEMAVICRSGGIVDEVADLLARSDLPVSTATRLRPLREESVVMDLLRIVEIGTGAGRLDGQEAQSLLRGPFGDADALRLRRIRRLLLDARRLAGEDPVASIDLLAEAVMGAEVPGLPAPDARDRAAAPVHRLRRMIEAVRHLGPEPAAADALWAAWDAAGVAEGWRTAAIGEESDPDGARSRLTSHRLDVVTALFAAVDRFTERRPFADALVFVGSIRDQAVAEDTLAPRAEPRGRVQVLTPAQIVGHSRDVVVLARVQEGIWPNTRLRSTLLGATDIGIEDLPGDAASLRALRRESVLADEVRLAVAALTRARHEVIVTAVDGGELSPSALVETVERSAGPGRIDAAALRQDPGPAPDMRRLVAALRADLLSSDGSASQRAAVLLARLEDAGAPGIDPGTWYHQGPSTSEPIIDPGSPLRLSPSALERASECPRAWLLERSGGTPEAGPAQSIGTSVHRLAQDHPRGVPEERVPDLLVELHRLLRPLDLEGRWSGRRQLVRAEQIAASLNTYLSTAPEALAVEVPFTVRLEDVELRGAIDRIEGDERSARVVDLKTGRAAKSAAAAEEDLQLAAYQVALRDGALAGALPGDPQPAGASLVYLGTPSVRPAVRTQGALDGAEDPRWFDEVVRQVSEDLRGDRVQARRCGHCERCSVRRSCPLWPEGAEL